MRKRQKEAREGGSAGWEPRPGGGPGSPRDRPGGAGRRTDNQRRPTDSGPLAPEMVAPGGDQGGTAYRSHSLVTPRTEGSAD